LILFYCEPLPGIIAGVIFWIFWTLDAIEAAIVVGFFVIGLGDGSVSSFNGGLWAIVLLVLAAILGGSLALRAAGQKILAIILLLVLLLPSILYGLFVLTFMVGHPRFN
jgi:hypothetical protein